MHFNLSDVVCGKKKMFGDVIRLVNFSSLLYSILCMYVRSMLPNDHCLEESVTDMFINRIITKVRISMIHV